VVRGSICLRCSPSHSRPLYPPHKGRSAKAVGDNREDRRKSFCENHLRDPSRFPQPGRTLPPRVKRRTYGRLHRVAARRDGVGGTPAYEERCCGRSCPFLLVVRFDRIATNATQWNCRSTGGDVSAAPITRQFGPAKTRRAVPLAYLARQIRESAVKQTARTARLGSVGGLRKACVPISPATPAQSHDGGSRDMVIGNAAP
jgi:hypothetical protein